MAFKFRKASCVAVGTFNIYIIQPEWLTRVGIFPENTELAVEANMSRPGFRLSSPHLKSIWYVSPGRLAIETESFDENCGALMASVLERLQWTPLEALGNNVSFQTPREDVESIPALAACEHAAVLPAGWQEARRAFGLTLQREGRDFTLQIAAGTKLVELNANANTRVADEPNALRAVEIAKGFLSDRALIANLYEETFGIRLKDDVASNA